MKKYSLLGLVILLIGLILLQNEAILPFVRRIVDTEVLRGNPEEGGQATAINSEKTAQAFIHCNQYIRQQFSDATSIEFPEHASKAWDIGFERYVVQAYVDIGDASGERRRKTYVCRIHYTGGTARPYDDWSVAGIEFSHEDASR